MKNLLFSLGLSICLTAALPNSAMAADEDQWLNCFEILNGSESVIRSYVHQVVTSRESADYDRVLNDKRLWNGIPFPDYSQLKSGNRTLLSLGEGGTRFVIRYLEVAANGIAKGPHRAVDIVYGNAELPSDFKPIFGDVIKKNPTFFLGQLFQEIRLTDRDGQLMKFDEIISSHALSYVLIREFAAKHNDEIALMISRLVEHLSKEGILRSWLHSSPILEKEFYAHLARVFEVLKVQGKIRDYGFFEPPKQMVELLSEIGKEPPNTSFWLRR